MIYCIREHCLYVFHKPKELHCMISDWILFCFSYDQQDGKVIEKGSSVDFGYKFVLCKSRVGQQLVKERCFPLLPGDSYNLWDYICLSFSLSR